MIGVTRIGILKMPFCNLQSVRNAFSQLGFDPVFVDESTDYEQLSHLVIPGVGQFAAVMNQLSIHGVPARVREFAGTGRPVLGICAGMQILARAGTEGGEMVGLGLVDALVDKLTNTGGLRLPHVGWSPVHFRQHHPIFEGLKSNRDYYFVHSYAMRLSDEGNFLGETQYGEPFVSIVGSDNVLGFQFHPEKSQINGLRLLENFCYWDGKC